MSKETNWIGTTSACTLKLFPPVQHLTFPGFPHCEIATYERVVISETHNKGFCRDEIWRLLDSAIRHRAMKFVLLVKLLAIQQQQCTLEQNSTIGYYTTVHSFDDALLSYGQVSSSNRTPTRICFRCLTNL